MNDLVLQLRKITKSFDNNQVLKGIDLDVERGTFVTLLGSSGCGKTTTLRIIAGLETPDSGQVLLNGADVTLSEPNKRNVNTVFQNYALFPHMSVFDNVAYSLKLKHMEKAEIKERVKRALELVQLSEYEKRMPAQLSGGQKQRVAIARSIISRPEVLLLDEPLGALDLQLRRQMQQELKNLQKKLGITFIYITHDQEEAINMSDQIVVMEEGIFVQQGSPAEIYDSPRNEYVARFVGSANIIKGSVMESLPGYAVVKSGCSTFRVPAHESRKTGEPAVVAVRSENLHFEKRGTAPASYLTGVIKEKSFAGGMLRIVAACEKHEDLVISRHGIDAKIQVGDPVDIYWDENHGVLLENEEDANESGK